MKLLQPSQLVKADRLLHGSAVGSWTSRAGDSATRLGTAHGLDESSRGHESLPAGSCSDRAWRVTVPHFPATFGTLPHRRSAVYAVVAATTKPDSCREVGDSPLF